MFFDMKTKLIITIEVDESQKETTDLFLKIRKNKKIKVSDIFDKDSEVFLKSMSVIKAKNYFININDFINGVKQTKHLDPTNLNLIMFKR